jgi:hypothetical protein
MANWVYQVNLHFEYDDHRFKSFLGAFTTFDLAVKKVEQYCRSRGYGSVIWDVLDKESAVARTKENYDNIFTVEPLQIQEKVEEWH